LGVRAVRRGDEVELTIRDPFALAASVRTGATRTPLSSLHVTLPAGRGAAPGAIELIDTYGNLLISTAIEPAPAPALVAAPAAPHDAFAPALQEPPWYGRWPPWALVAGGFATLSVAAWWIADDADHQAHETGDEDEEASLKRRRDVATWVSRGALVGMGVAITAGIVVYVRGRDQRVIATPQPGGGGLAWRVTF
ncbi:MAG TPA: hypothetical protein VHW23_08640, partial [Kofleriaceae bacterium]|nr:hypothetical protein [Kofleriaceae bacterium]